MTWRPAFDAAFDAAASMSGQTVRAVMSPRARSPARTAAMRALRDAGMPLALLAQALGIRADTAGETLRRAVPRMRNPAYASLVRAAAAAAAPLAPARTPRRRKDAWTDDDTAAALRLREHGATTAEIGERLGRSASAVQQQFSRLRSTGAEVPAPPGRTHGGDAPNLHEAEVDAHFNRDWTEREDEIVRQGRRAGMSFRALQERLPGRTKSAIIGRAHRIGVTIESPKPRTFHKFNGNRLRPVRVEVTAARVCQWIERSVPECLDADGGAPFCGEPVVPGTSWCPHHGARVWSRREAEEGAISEEEKVA